MLTSRLEWIAKFIASRSKSFWPTRLSCRLGKGRPGNSEWRESAEYVVEYGLKHWILMDISTSGGEEIQYLVGRKYLTLVYQIDAGCQRLLLVGKDRTAKTLLRFFYRFKGYTDQIKFVCNDTLKYLGLYLRIAVRQQGGLPRFSQ